MNRARTASFLESLSAFAIDGLIALGIATLPDFFWALSRLDLVRTPQDLVSLLGLDRDTYPVGVLFTWLLYGMASWTRLFGGRTVGKRLMGIAVVRQDGTG